jgi:hypothetical protein
MIGTPASSARDRERTARDLVAELLYRYGRRRGLWPDEAAHLRDRVLARLGPHEPALAGGSSARAALAELARSEVQRALAPDPAGTPRALPVEGDDEDWCREWRQHELRCAAAELERDGPAELVEHLALLVAGKDPRALAASLDLSPEEVDARTDDLKQRLERLVSTVFAGSHPARLGAGG